jgi:hypothetical protein
MWNQLGTDTFEQDGPGKRRVMPSMAELGRWPERSFIKRQPEHS